MQEPWQARSETRAAWAFGHASADDADILRQDAAFTMRQANCRPGLLAVAEAENIYVRDGSGRRYIDLHGNNCHHIGYRHPKLIAALQDQLGRLTCNTRGFTNAPFAAFAETLAAEWPGTDGRVFMVPGGSAAVELALAIARVHSGRFKTIAFEDSYHGRSFGAVSLTASPRHRSPKLGPMLPQTYHVPSFRTNAADAEARRKAAETSFAAIRQVIEAERDIACLIAEPMAVDARRPPDWYWPDLRALCDRHQILLVFDEVPTGLGKIGHLFASQTFGVVPDMTVLGKALGGAALPVAAVIAGGHLDTAPDLDLGYFTHEKNPLMARAAQATLSIIDDEALIGNVGAQGAFALDLLTQIQERHAGLIPEPVRGQGGMLSFDIAGPKGDASSDEATALSLFYRCIERGLILNFPAYGTRFSLSLPFVVTRAQVSLACEILDSALCSN